MENKKTVYVDKDLGDVEQRLTNAHDALQRLCDGERFTMHIPAQPHRDIDLLISNSLNDVRGLVNTISALRAMLLGEGWTTNTIDACLALRAASAPPEEIAAATAMGSA